MYILFYQVLLQKMKKKSYEFCDIVIFKTRYNFIVIEGKNYLII